jgi:hypothetical protein
MKKTVILACFFILLASPCLALNINDFLGGGNPQQGQKQNQCPNCTFINPPGVNYCGQCGRQLQAGGSQFPGQGSMFGGGQHLYCPYCRKKNTYNLSNTPLYCQSCHAQVPYGARNCNNCGASLQGMTYTCNYCSKSVPFNYSNPSSPTILCPYCNSWYEAEEEDCSRCHHGRGKGHHDDDDDDDDDDHGHHSKSDSHGTCSLGAFTKSNYDSEVAKYAIGGFTSNRSFSKVIVNVHVTEKHAVIINTIKVKVGGQWMNTDTGTRTKEGRNEFSVSIPQGATELLLSLNHGKGSQISVSIE